MNLLLTIVTAITCIVLLVSALLIVLVGLLASTSSCPLVERGDPADNHQNPGSEAL
jgi:hypothetical protein